MNMAKMNTEEKMLHRGIWANSPTLHGGYISGIDTYGTRFLTYMLAQSQHGTVWYCKGNVPSHAV